MKTIAISAEGRNNIGSKYAARIRKEERVPGVLYGGKENKHFSVRALDLRSLTHTTNTHIVELDIEGEGKMNAMLKEVQYHPVTDAPIHVDLIEIQAGERIAVKLAIKLVGQAVGVRQGGKLAQPLRRIKVAGIPADMPEQLEVDISKLKVGEIIRIRDLKLDGLELLGRGDSVIAAVKTARTVVATDDEEGEETEGAEGDDAAKEEAPAES